MRTEIPFCILSACRPEYSPEANDVRSYALAAQLRARNLDFAAVDGFYKGTAELSFIVLTPTKDGGRAEALVLLLAARYAQEAVLLVDANRSAELRTVDYSRGLAAISWGPAMALGRWREVQSTEGLEAYTRTRDGRTWAAGR